MTEPTFTTATEAPAVAGRLDQPVRPPPPERAEFVAWLRAYAGGGDHWRGKVLMGEHDIALALWKDMQRQLARVRSEQQALRIAHHCMAPACPGSSS